MRADRAEMSRLERRYWRRHAATLVDTMAAPYAADVVGLLKDDASYGAAGDHGGAQRAVQEIPIVFAGAGVGPSDRWRRLRSVDILPTVLRAMGIPPGSGLDGRAARLPRG